MTWLEANYSCPAGYSLASVHNTPERSFVANLTSDPFWLGGVWSTDNTASSTVTLQWSDGQVDPAGCSAQPDSELQQTLGSEHGLAVNMVRLGSWSHLQADTALPFLCKKGRSSFILN